MPSPVPKSLISSFSKATFSRVSFSSIFYPHPNLKTLNPSISNALPSGHPPQFNGEFSSLNPGAKVGMTAPNNVPQYHVKSNLPFPCSTLSSTSHSISSHSMNLSPIACMFEAKWLAGRSISLTVSRNSQKPEWSGHRRGMRARCR